MLLGLAHTTSFLPTQGPCSAKFKTFQHFFVFSFTALIKLSELSKANSFQLNNAVPCINGPFIRAIFVS